MSWDIHYDNGKYYVFSTVSMGYITDGMDFKECFEFLDNPKYYGEEQQSAGRKLLLHNMQLAKYYGTDENRPWPPDAGYEGKRDKGTYPEWVYEGARLYYQVNSWSRPIRQPVRKETEGKTPEEQEKEMESKKTQLPLKLETYMCEKITKVANSLDKKGFYQEATELDKIASQIVNAGVGTSKIYSEINDHFGPESEEAHVAGYLVGGFPEHSGREYKRLKILSKLLKGGHKVKKAPINSDKMVVVDGVWMTWDEYDYFESIPPKKLMEVFKKNEARKRLSEEKNKEVVLRYKYKEQLPEASEKVKELDEEYLPK